MSEDKLPSITAMLQTLGIANPIKLSVHRSRLPLAMKTEAMDWLTGLERACNEGIRIWRLQPKEMWEKYEAMGSLFGVGEMREVRLLAEQKKLIRQILQSRPIYFQPKKVFEVINGQQT